MMGDFILWVLPQWHEFWGRFQPDGTMSWEQFENFVHWEGHWSGDTRRIFALFDRKNVGYISKPIVLDTRRKWEYAKDRGFMTIEDFRRKFAELWGTLGRGWRLALDTNDMGHCCQLHFMRVCHDMGMSRNLKTLWFKLTAGEVQRNICFRDLDPECDQILKHFCLALSCRNGSIREGWCAICRAGGGHLHKRGFVRACSGLGIPAKEAKTLYAVLDPFKIRYLTEYDKLDFLSLWTPSPATVKQGMPGMLVIKELKSGGGAATALLGDEQGLDKNSQSDINLGQFEFKVRLSKDEYSEYLRRRRGSKLATGGKKGVQDSKAGTQRRRIEPPGGNKPRPPSAPPKMQSSKDAMQQQQSVGSNVEENRWAALMNSRMLEQLRAPQERPTYSLGGLIKCDDDDL
mmetsp:Transcript_10547/g.19410  ORF Transcript_10547/g.19410 Transcript_10547/m.19410 type:complete len:402 (+) Transcript_10547:2-1207(+)